eukprot:1270911-Rhodomonas_salina.3
MRARAGIMCGGMPWYLCFFERVFSPALELRGPLFDHARVFHVGRLEVALSPPAAAQQASFSRKCKI